MISAREWYSPRRPSHLLSDQLLRTHFSSEQLPFAPVLKLKFKVETPMDSQSMSLWLYYRKETEKMQIWGCYVKYIPFKLCHSSIEPYQLNLTSQFVVFNIFVEVMHRFVFFIVCACVYHAAAVSPPGWKRCFWCQQEVGGPLWTISGRKRDPKLSASGHVHVLCKKVLQTQHRM